MNFLGKIPISNRKIRTIGLGMLVFLFAASSFFSYTQNLKIEKELTVINTTYQPRLREIDAMLKEFTDIKDKLTTFVIDELTDLKPILKESLVLVKSAEALSKKLTSEREQRLIKEFTGKIKEYRVGMIAYSEELAIRRTGEGVRSWERTLLDLETSAHDIAVELKNSILDEIEEHEAIMAQATLYSKRLNIIVGLAGILIGFAIAILLQKTLSAPLNQMANLSKKVADGDLRLEIARTQDEEINVLTSSFANMISSLKVILTKIGGITGSISDVTSQMTKSSEDVIKATEVQKQAIEETFSATDDLNTSISHIATSTESLSEAARESSSAILETKTAINTIADNAHTFTETANETASSVEEMVATMKSIAENVDALSTTSDEIASSIEEVYTTTKDIEKSAGESVSMAETVMMNASDKGMNAYRAAIEGMEVIKKNVSALANVINVLGKKSEDIGMILGVINDVSDQTNLLSVNAAILASKAGEHGRGFAVVADQIKELAERALLSTNEIGNLITSVQEETRSSVKIASEGLQAVDQGMKLAKEINEALNEIIDSSKVSTDMAKSIQRATTEEAIVIKQITAAIENMSEQTEAISNALQEQYKGSTFIMGETEKVKDISLQVSTATNEQKEVSNQIASAIENVAAQAFQIAGSTNSQKEKSTAILQSMDKIQSSTQTLMSSTEAMNAVLSKLKEESLNLMSAMERFKI
ncbi:MAG: HAMP domain-containing protein [Nitrospiraceae bacterium]|nr:MAG: HAMP domain-containing protein [Nitrospiraceae bacterium]